MKIILYGVLCFCISSYVFADNLNSLEEMMSQYVLLKKEISHEKVRWKENKSILFMQLDLLKKETQHFETEIKKIKEQNNFIVSRMDQLKKEKKDYEQVFKNVENYLDKLKNEIKKFVRVLPKSLITTITTLLSRLDSERDLDIIERFKLILICISEIEDLENSIILKQEILTVANGKELEFQVLYMGLAQAFCLSIDSKIAGYGLFKEEGLIWHLDNSLTHKIQRAIDIYSQKEAVNLTSLPVLIVLGGQE